MPKANYAWKRFWCPRGGSLRLTNRGFLVVPDQEWSYHYTDVVPFEAIADRQCLVLLGEPGIGKTTALETQQQELEQGISQKGGKALFCDLKGYSSEERLIKEIFNSPDFLDWVVGDYPLHLFLDSLDECQLRLETLPTILLDQLSQLAALDRLFLRIACRTMDWPLYLEEGLKKLWRPESVKVEVYELAPLSEEDVRLAARQSNIDADVFIQQVRSASAVPLAAKPVTLSFLLNTFRRSSEITSSKWDLYRVGCRILCEETSESRWPARLGDYTADERLDAASQIAAATILSGYSAVWKEIDLGNVPSYSLTITELARASGKPGLSESLIRETISTGLFTARGQNQMGWAHQTYGEFLAAYYLVENELTFDQMISLLAHPDDPQGRIVPQLHETAAWTAVKQLKILKHLVRSDPNALFRSEVVDISTMNESEQAELLENYLQLYETKQKLSREFVNEYYDKLSYPGLEDQLANYIGNRDNNLYVRRAAIDIATACDLPDLQDLLLGIALDPSEEYLRTDAAYAVLQSDDPEAREALKPLALEQAGPDYDDELKGIGLQAVWPDYLTPTELFQVLRPPKRDSLIGMYHRFLSSNPIEQLAVADLPLALSWVEKQQVEPDGNSRLQDVINAIMLKGWDNLNAPNVLEAYARATLSRLLQYRSIVERRYGGTPTNLLEKRVDAFSKEIVNDHQRRRQLLTAVVSLLDDPKEQYLYLNSSNTLLITSDDLSWLISQLSEISDEYQDTYLRLVELAANRQNAEHLDIISYAIDSGQLPDRFSTYLSVAINSPRAESARRMIQIGRERQERERENEELRDQLFEDIEELLVRCENGDLDVWWQLNHKLLVNIDEKGPLRFVSTALDLSAHPVWRELSAGLKVRVLDVAEQYVTSQELTKTPWFEEYLSEGTRYYPAYSGVRALFIASKLHPKFTNDLSSAIWGRWAPFVCAYPFSNENSEALPRFMYQFYEKAPDQVIDAVLKVIRQEIQIHGDVFALHRFENCWDKRFCGAILEFVRAENLPPAALSTLLQNLMKNGCQHVAEYAESLVQTPFENGSEDERRTIVAVAAALIEHADDAGWNSIWPLIQNDEAFADDLFSRIAVGGAARRSSFQSKLSAKELSALYTWLETRYSHDEDPNTEGFHSVTEREHIGWLRDSILTTLTEVGTPESVNSLRDIVQQLPEDRHWHVLAKAQDNLLRRSWQPPAPTVIFDLAKSEEGKLVNSGDQLLEVVIASLARLETELQGETPSVIDVWDTYAKRPKDENAFSDYVKRFLQRDLTRQGIVLSREVQIRRETGGSSGELTDIHVDAVATNHGEHNVVSVIIETKGVWHREILTAMQTQLVERYLADNRCRHGLYLVGWFNCNQWDNDDNRKSRAERFESIEELQNVLDEQARDLSTVGLKIKAVVINASLR